MSEAVTNIAIVFEVISHGETFFRLPREITMAVFVIKSITVFRQFVQAFQ